MFTQVFVGRPLVPNIDLLHVYLKGWMDNFLCFKLLLYYPIRMVKKKKISQCHGFNSILSVVEAEEEPDG